MLSILTCVPAPYLNKSLCETPQPSKSISNGLSYSTNSRTLLPALLLQHFAEALSTPLCLLLEGVSVAFPAPYLAPCLAQSGCPKRLLL